MFFTLSNHVHGVLHVAVDATGNNSLRVFNFFFFFDLLRGASHGTPGPVAPYLLAVQLFSILKY